LARGGGCPRECNPRGRGEKGGPPIREEPGGGPRGGGGGGGGGLGLTRGVNPRAIAIAIALERAGETPKEDASVVTLLTIPGGVKGLGVRVNPRLP